MQDKNLLDSLFNDNGDSNVSEFASRLLLGEKVEIVDPIEEKKKAIREAQQKPKLTEEEQQERLSRTLFLGNVPGDLPKRKLQSICEEFGEVETIRYRGLAFNDSIKVPKKIAAIRKEYDQNQSVVAYVLYKTVEERNKAIEGLNRREVDGAFLRADAASEPHKKREISEEVQNRTVFVGQLNKDVNEEQLRKIFSSAGEIDYVYMPKDANHHTKNIAYITYLDERDVETALKFNGSIINEREIVVQRSNIKQAKKDKEAHLKEKGKNKKKPTKGSEKPKTPKKSTEKKGKGEKAEGDDETKKQKSDKPATPNAKLSFQGKLSKPTKNKNIFIKKYLKKKRSFNKGKQDK